MTVNEGVCGVWDVVRLCFSLPPHLMESACIGAYGATLH